MSQGTRSRSSKAKDGEPAEPETARPHHPGITPAANSVLSPATTEERFDEPDQGALMRVEGESVSVLDSATADRGWEGEAE